MVTRNPDQTRERILQAAFEEIHRNGFRSASVDQILAETGLTKGALYHHFPNKAALGYAVVDEIIRGRIQQMWVSPIARAENPLDGLRDAFLAIPAADMERACTMGCPLNNLAQEMSPIDEEFRLRIEAVYKSWHAGVVEQLEIGKDAGYVRADVDCLATTTFMIASIEGAAGLAKNAQDPKVLMDCMAGILQFLESLRPVPVPA